MLTRTMNFFICRSSSAIISCRQQIGIGRGTMNIGCLVVLAVVFASYPSSAQKADPDLSTKEQIKSLEEERNRAILRGDAAALDRMTSDDYTFITLRGELRTKAEIVKGFQSGSFKYESRTISDLNIRLYGDTAIVTGRSTQKGVENGKDYSGDYRFTRVYVKENGRWLTVALQTTPVRP
jgi:ketosteroid isomerase-like protein